MPNSLTTDQPAGSVFEIVTPTGTLSVLTAPGGTVAGVASRVVTGNFAFVAADDGGIVFVNSAGAVNATINDGVFPAATPTSPKTLLTVVQLGVGQVTIVGGGAQVIRTDLTKQSFGQYAGFGALQSSNANEWIAIGDRALS